MRLAVAATLLVVISIAPGEVCAQKPAPAPERGQAGHERYPLLLVGVDLLSIAIGGAVHPTLGVLGFVVGSPIAHAAKSNGRGALASGALRLTVPAGSVLLGVALGRSSCPVADPEFGVRGDDRNDCIFEHALILGGIGILATLVIDYAVLARVARSPGGREPPPRKRFLRVAPAITPVPGGAAVGLVGSF